MFVQKLWLHCDSETAWKEGNTSVSSVEWEIYLVGSTIPLFHLMFSFFLYVRLFLLFFVYLLNSFLSLPVFAFLVLLFSFRLFNFIYVLISYSVFVLFTFFFVFSIFLLRHVSPVLADVIFLTGVVTSQPFKCEIASYS